MTQPIQEVDDLQIMESQIRKVVALVEQTAEVSLAMRFGRETPGVPLGIDEVGTGIVAARPLQKSTSKIRQSSLELFHPNQVIQWVPASFAGEALKVKRIPRSSCGSEDDFADFCASPSDLPPRRKIGFRARRRVCSPRLNLETLDGHSGFRTAALTGSRSKGSGFTGGSLLFFERLRLRQVNLRRSAPGSILCSPSCESDPESPDANASKRRFRAVQDPQRGRSESGISSERQESGQFLPPDHPCPKGTMERVERIELFGPHFIYWILNCQEGVRPSEKRPQRSGKR